MLLLFGKCIWFTLPLITELTRFKYYQFTGKRRTASFGWQYEFGTNEITTAPDVPEFLLPVRMRAGARLADTALASTPAPLSSVDRLLDRRYRRSS